MPANSTTKSAPVALTIAGSDSGANAGAQADLLTFASNGVYGTSALTCLTAQNPEGITAIKTLAPDFVIEQIKQVFTYFKPSALKTGMLYDAGIIEAVSTFLSKYSDFHIVIDPVMVATSGKPLLKDEAIEFTKSKLLPLAKVITPNLDEAKILSESTIDSLEDMKRVARSLASQYHTFALVKGGHLEGDELYDVLASPDGNVQTYLQDRIHEIDTHGSGCTLSAAIAANLAKGYPPEEAIEWARTYLRAGMETPVQIAGQPFINHFA